MTTHYLDTEHGYIINREYLLFMNFRYWQMRRTRRNNSNEDNTQSFNVDKNRQ